VNGFVATGLIWLINVIIGLVAIRLMPDETTPPAKNDSGQRRFNTKIE
jgi:hypothetical protein